MCGRYAATAGVDELVEAFDLDLVTDDGAAASAPRWNVAPMSDVPAVVERIEGDAVVRKLVSLRWGLVPSWAGDARGGARLVNARSETVATKPSFRKAFAARRCILPALGYYEWRAETEAGRQVKQPYFLHPVAGGILAMAGIYEFWKGPDGWLATCSIITTRASDDTGWVHDRMPMTPTDRDAWLDPRLTSPDAVLGLLQAPEGLGIRKVSRLVNRAGEEGAQLVAEVP